MPPGLGKLSTFLITWIINPNKAPGIIKVEGATYFSFLIAKDKYENKGTKNEIMKKELPISVIIDKRESETNK